MQSVKLVQSVLVFCVALTHLRGVRMESDEDETNGDARIIYDQRQSGKYNIHVVIKDVAIIEMDQNEIEDSNYNDEEYYYDENDLTIKPITLHPTTKMPLTTTTKQMKTQTNEKSTLASQTKFPPTINVDSQTTLTNQPDETTTLTSSILWSTLSSLISKKPPSEEVVSTETSTKHSAAKTATDVKPRSKVEPIYAIEEAPLQPKYRDDYIPLEHEAKSLANSKIYKVKVHRSHQPHHYTPQKIQSRRCRSNQYRDLSGNCRTKRSPSGSLLKRLVSMLVTLPFVRGEQQHNED